MNDGTMNDERWDCVGIYSNVSCHPEYSGPTQAWLHTMLLAMG